MKLSLICYLSLGLTFLPAEPAQNDAHTTAPAVEDLTAVANTPELVAIADASRGMRTFIPHSLEVPSFTPPPPPVVKRP